MILLLYLLADPITDWIAEPGQILPYLINVVRYECLCRDGKLKVHALVALSLINNCAFTCDKKLKQVMGENDKTTRENKYRMDGCSLIERVDFRKSSLFVLSAKHSLRSSNFRSSLTSREVGTVAGSMSKS